MPAARRSVAASSGPKYPWRSQFRPCPTIAELPVIRVYGSEITISIAAGREKGVNDDAFAGKVEGAQRNGHPRRNCDVVEA